MQELYSFNLKDFDEEGVNKINREFFIDIIKDWEEDFYKKFFPYKATHFLSSQSTMSLIDKSLDLNKNEKSGMDLIDGEIDIDTNINIEKHSKYHTIYAIESGIQENEDDYEALFLVIDDSLAEGLVLLKYISDSEDDEVEEPLPIIANKKVKV